MCRVQSGECVMSHARPLWRALPFVPRLCQNHGSLRKSPKPQLIFFRNLKASLKMEKLFDNNRFPAGLKIIPVFLYLPVGIALAFLRFFFGLQTLLAAVLLQKLSAIRSIILRVMCCTLGLVVREENTHDESVPLVVSNHVSILDHVAFHLAIGSAGMCSQNAPFVIQHALGFKTFEKIKIPSGDKYDLQPEGVVTNGKHGLLKFRTVPSSISNVVQPATLRIWRLPLTDVSSNALGATWLGDLFWFLVVPVTVVTIKYLPVLRKEDGETDEDWTRRMEKAIAADLGLQVTEFTAADKTELERQLLPIDAQLNLLGPAQMAIRLKDNFPSLSLEVIRSEIERTRNIRVAIANLMRMRAEKGPGGSASADIRKSEFYGGHFPKSAQDRMASFQERKALLIETARKRYLEKRALNIASS